MPRATVHPTTDPTDSPTDGVTVYFDGSCPLCRREISLYQRSESDARLRWHDVSQCVPDAPGLSPEIAMARFHVRDAQGQLHSGARAFVVLWRQLPGWRWLTLLAALPGVTPLLEWAYVQFLKVRPRIQTWVRAHEKPQG